MLLLSLPSRRWWLRRVGGLTGRAAGGERPWLGFARKLSTSGTEGEEEHCQSTRPGQHKTPIVDMLWNLRRDLDKQTRALVAEEKERQRRHDEPKPSYVVERTPSESRTEVLYEFSRDAALREKYVNPWGKIRVGRIIEDLDALAGTIAFKHCYHGDPQAPELMIVTASIDRIVLGHRANLKDNITLKGQVTWVGRSSMEIQMSAVSSWTNKPWLSALFSFVAIDKTTGKSTQINTLKPETEEEKRTFTDGEARNEMRRKMRKERTELLITKKRKGLLNEHDLNDMGTDQKVSLQAAAELLLEEAIPYVHLPSLAPKNCIPISKTALENGIIMQPQQRNTAGRVFGGFLVRRAFELAFATAYLFSGECPRFLEIDEVTFQRPVDVGNLVRFKSRVLYSSMEIHNVPSVHVEVTAWVTLPEQRTTYKSNSFHFTFTIADLEKKEAPIELRQVIPETIEDALAIVQRFQQDLYQKAEDEQQQEQQSHK